VSVDVGSSGAVWRDFGGAVTIQCRVSETDQMSLDLKRGLNEKSVLFIDGSSDKYYTGKEFSGRIQFNGKFPNMDIIIKNLTSDDTGLYWCKYTRFDPESSDLVSVKGHDSLLLVVTGEPLDSYTHQIQNIHYRSKVWDHLEMTLFFKEKHFFSIKITLN